MEENSFVERSIKYQKLRRKARRGEIAVNRLYKFIRFCIVVFMIYCTVKVFNLHYWYFPSDLYSKPVGERIDIVGNSIVPTEKIFNEIKKFPQEKKPVYKINPEKIARQIESLQPVKRTYIRRFWFPARYSVMIEEVTPALIISPSEDAPAVAAFALDGSIIGREYLPFDFPNNAVKILSYGTKGDDYEKWDKEKINELYNICKLIEEYSGEKLVYLDLRNPHDIFAQTESAKFRLGEQDTALKERIKSVKAILPVLKQMKEPVLYADLSWKDSKYIKMKD